MNKKYVLSLLLSFLTYWVTQGLFAYEAEQLVVGRDIVKMSTTTGKIVKKHRLYVHIMLKQQGRYKHIRYLSLKHKV